MMNDMLRNTMAEMMINVNVNNEFDEEYDRESDVFMNAIWCEWFLVILIIFDDFQLERDRPTNQPTDRQSLL